MENYKTYSDALPLQFATNNLNWKQKRKSVKGLMKWNPLQNLFIFKEENVYSQFHEMGNSLEFPFRISISYKKLNFCSLSIKDY